MNNLESIEEIIKPRETKSPNPSCDENRAKEQAIDKSIDQSKRRNGITHQIKQSKIKGNQN